MADKKTKIYKGSAGGCTGNASGVHTFSSSKGSAGGFLWLDLDRTRDPYLDAYLVPTRNNTNMTMFTWNSELVQSVYKQYKIWRIITPTNPKNLQPNTSSDWSSLDPSDMISNLTGDMLNITQYAQEGNLYRDWIDADKYANQYVVYVTTYHIDDMYYFRWISAWNADFNDYAQLYNRCIAEAPNLSFDPDTNRFTIGTSMPGYRFLEFRRTDQAYGESTGITDEETLNEMLLTSMIYREEGQREYKYINYYNINSEENKLHRWAKRSDPYTIEVRLENTYNQTRILTAIDEAIKSINDVLAGYGVKFVRSSSSEGDITITVNTEKKLYGIDPENASYLYAGTWETTVDEKTNYITHAEIKLACDYYDYAPFMSYETAALEELAQSMGAGYDQTEYPNDTLHTEFNYFNKPSTLTTKDTNILKLLYSNKIDVGYSVHEVSASLNIPQGVYKVPNGDSNQTIQVLGSFLQLGAEYEVRAFIVDGNAELSKTSNWIKINVPANTPEVELTPPTNYVVSNRKNGGFTLSWDSVDGAEGYQLMLYRGYDNKLISAVNVTGQISYEFTGLNPGVTYYVKAYSYSTYTDQTIMSSISDKFKVTTNPSQLNISAVAISEDQLKLNWELTDKEGAYTGILALVFQSYSDSFAGAIDIKYEDSLSYTGESVIDILNVAESGGYSIEAYTYYDDEDVSGARLYCLHNTGVEYVARCSVQPISTPIPKNLRLSRRFNKGCELAWDSLTGVTEYKLVYWDWTKEEHEITSSTASATLTNLTPGLTYTAKVKSCANGAEGEWSDTFQFTTSPAQPIISASVNGNNVTVNWSLADTSGTYTYIHLTFYNSNNEALERYHIPWDASNPMYSGSVSFTVAVSGKYYIKSATEYIDSISGESLWCLDSAGNNYITTYDIIIGGQETLLAPTNLHVVQNRYKGCKFAWNATAGVNGVTASVGYNVEVLYGDRCVWTLSTTATEVDITGLQCSRAYTIRVQAWQVQSDGSVVYSEWVTMEKSYVTYPPKPNIDKISQTNGDITVEWSWEDGDIKDVSQVYYTLYRKSDDTALIRGSTIPEKKYGSCTFAQADPGDYYVAVTTMFEYNGQQLWCVDENGNQYKAMADITVPGEGLSIPELFLNTFRRQNETCDVLIVVSNRTSRAIKVEIGVYESDNNKLIFADSPLLTSVFGDVNNSSYWISGLKYNTAYRIDARFEDATGAKGEWGTLNFTTPTKAIMGASFAAVNGGIKITWDMVENATKYRINLTDTTTGIKTSQEAITSPYTWLGLKYGVKYKCTIDVYNGVWQEGTSTFEFVTPPARPVIESAIWSKKEKKIKVVWSLEHPSEIGEVGVYIYPKGSNSSVAGKTVNDGSTWGTTEFSSVTGVGVYTVVVTSSVPNIGGLGSVYSLADDGSRYRATRDVVIEKADIEYWSWHRGTDTDVIADSDRGRAYDALTTKGLLSEFTYQTWNELVDKVQEVIDYINDNDAEGCWQTQWFTDGGRLSKNGTYMYYNDKKMTAARFNALRYNIGTRCSTGIADKSLGDPIFGDYFVMLTDALNRWIYDVAVWKAEQDAIRENQN